MNRDRFQVVEPVTSQVGQSNPAFVTCPVALQTWTGNACPWEQVYRIAFERAQAVTRPSIVQRLQANLLN